MDVTRYIGIIKYINFCKCVWAMFESFYEFMLNIVHCVRHCIFDMHDVSRIISWLGHSGRSSIQNVLA
jgi:hypothetical protein